MIGPGVEQKGKIRSGVLGSNTISPDIERLELIDGIQVERFSAVKQVMGVGLVGQICELEDREYGRTIWEVWQKEELLIADQLVVHFKRLVTGMNDGIACANCFCLDLS